MTNTQICLKDVWKIYQLGSVELTVLAEINLEIKVGDFVVILGPSGSGKSTLLNLISCLDTPTKGEVFLAGENVSTLTEDELAEVRGRKIGFVFQQFNLLPHLSAMENVALPTVFQGLEEDQRQKRAIELLSSLGLEARVNHRPLELSGGEQQRVAVARSLINDPEIIVADEPTGNVDSHTGENIMKILNDLNKQKGKTMIIVTNDANLAHVGHQIINIKDGRIVSTKRND